jgi:hypothetical protein
MTLTIKNNQLTWEDPPGTKYAVTGLPVLPGEPPTTTPPPTQPPTLPPVGTDQGIWLSHAEIERLPMTGAAWDAVLTAANKSISGADLNNQDSPNNVITLAKALVAVRTGDAKYRNEVIAIAGNLPEPGDRTLALGRELAAYVVAADLVGIPPAQLESKLRSILTKKLSDGRTLIETHKQRPNNWGTFAGASIAAVAAYLGDKTLLDATATVFRGWLGDRNAYSGFKFGDLSWQPDPKNPVAVGLPGATGHGQSLDGALPEELRRANGYNNYVWGALSGTVEQAMFLHRAGYPAFEWVSKAIYRAVKWPHDLGHEATGDDAWLIPVVNQVYGTSFPVNGTGPGKGMGWTQWTHA